MGILEEKIRILPEAPGVYLMKGAGDAVLYVGKAKDLKARVKAYVGSGVSSSTKSRFLVPKIQALDYIVTSNEKEALLLEDTLIKKYRPRYNVNLKDDKTYVSLMIDLNHPFPRIALVRRPEARPGVLIFGPYTSASAARETLRQIHKLYPLRICKDSEFHNRKRPCVNCQMHRCSGPCLGGISQEAYKEMVDQAIMVLQGRNEELIHLLENKMNEASEAMKFEEAALLRDRINAVWVTIERQRVVTTSRTDQDVYGLYQEGSHIEMSILLIRGGSLVECKGFSFSQVLMEPSEVLASFLIQYYSMQGQAGTPEEVLLPIEPEGLDVLEEMLGEFKKGAFRLLVPKRGEKYELILMANLNAKTRYQDEMAEDRIHWIAMEEIKERLRMDRLPRRIECFDISAVQGSMAVGSRVMFTDGVPDKRGYRRYRIRVPVGADDYAMMYEVLFRRCGQDKENEPLPDLLLIDGGKGHLNVALRVLRDVEIKGIRVAGIAKVRKTRPNNKEDLDQEEGFDRIFLPEQVQAVRFHPHSRGVHLLQQVRNEAHRFAIAYHRKLRSKALQGSELDCIPGVGGTRKRLLLAHFGDIELIREATIDQLCTVPHIPKYVAAHIWNYLHPHDSSDAKPAYNR